MSVKPDVTFHFRFRWHLLASLFSRSIFSYARFPWLSPTARHSLPRPSDVMDLIGRDLTGKRFATKRKIACIYS